MLYLSNHLSALLTMQIELTSLMICINSHQAQIQSCCRILQALSVQARDKATTSSADAINPKDNCKQPNRPAGYTLAAY